MAQRTRDIVTLLGQVHVHQPLLAIPQPWQQLIPITGPICGIFSDFSPSVQALGGAYAWALRRPYGCCKREGQTFLGSTGIYRSTLSPMLQDAMAYTLRLSGYRLFPGGEDVAGLYALPSPAAHYRQGLLPLREALQVLAGPA